jgi:hypothetical protein
MIAGNSRKCLEKRAFGAADRAGIGLAERERRGPRRVHGRQLGHDHVETSTKRLQTVGKSVAGEPHSLTICEIMAKTHKKSALAAVLILAECPVILKIRHVICGFTLTEVVAVPG